MSTVLWEAGTEPGVSGWSRHREAGHMWLSANGINPADVVPGTSVRIVRNTGRLFVATWRYDRDGSGATVKCLCCQTCQRGHDTLTLFVEPLPPAVAACGWADADAADSWLDDINSVAVRQNDLDDTGVRVFDDLQPTTVISDAPSVLEHADNWWAANSPVRPFGGNHRA